MQIQVSIDVRHALKRTMKVKEGGEWFWVNFRYELLPTFCFICWVLGHADSTCNLLFENPDGFTERAYGIWIRANANTRGAALREPNGYMTGKAIEKKQGWKRTALRGLYKVGTEDNVEAVNSAILSNKGTTTNKLPPLPLNRGGHQAGKGGSSNSNQEE